MSNPLSLTTISVQDFFKEAVQQALKNQPVQPDEATSWYLVELLCEYLTCADYPVDESLTHAIAEADRQLPEFSMQTYKHVGDHALYMAGFFGPALRRHHLDVSYFNNVGETAYRRLSTMLRRRHAGAPVLSQVYNDLASDFSQYVEVLAEVRINTDSSQQDIGTLYEEWICGGNNAALRRLMAMGFSNRTCPNTN